MSLTLEDRQPRTDMEITSAITRSALAALTPRKEGDS